jgi:hypothetical protein
MLFSLGQVVMTCGIAELVSAGEIDIISLLARHVTGDWGDLDAEDRQANDTGVRIGERLLSSYCVSHAVGKVWIITEWDRSYTTALLPDEY